VGGEVERLECEADQSTPSSAKGKNEQSYTSSPPISHHGENREKSCYLIMLFRVGLHEPFLR
jgi:hypothetical protein